MKKWVCPVCGYVHEGDVPPAECPVCHVSGDKFLLQSEEKSWAAEHVVGVGKVFGDDVPEDVRKEIIDGLRANFEGECSEVGMYLAMARVAHREGYPEIGLYWDCLLYTSDAADEHQEEPGDARGRRERRYRRQVRAGEAGQEVQSGRHPRHRP